MGLRGRRNAEEEERRYYQGPSERMPLNQEAEYMTASLLLFCENFKLFLCNKGRVHI